MNLTLTPAYALSRFAFGIMFDGWLTAPASKTCSDDNTIFIN